MRIETVLDYGFTKEGIDKRNPARWKGNLDNLLPNPLKMAKAAGKGKSHPAAPWREVPAIMEQLRNKPDVSSALALRFSILTASRSTEARGMVWSEVDLDKEVWTVPAERTKNGDAHSVPLCGEAVAILQARQERGNAKAPEMVFPGPSGGLLSDVAVNKSLALAAKSAGLDAHITAHGTARSSFRDWVAEATSFPDKVAEAALNHKNPNITEAAYLRTKFFDRRVELMSAWGDFCAGKSNVVQLAAQA